MIAPEYHIRDCVEADMDLIRYLFSVEGFSDLTSPEGIRVAVTPDNTMYGACRLEQGSDGSWNVRPIVVFDVVQGKGVGRALLKDALRLHPDLRLVARGEIEPFYLSCGFERCGWDAIAPEYRAECDACPDKAACGPLPFRSLPIERTFTFLGTSSGCGVPAFFCHCPACEEARKDPTKRRGCTGVALRGHGTTIIDASPDIRHQLNREGIDVIDDFFLTHAHYDHMGGLGEFEYFIRLYLMGTMPFHGSEHAIAEALKEYSYMDDCFALDAMNPYDVREVDGLAIQALPLKHAPGTFGYLITTPEGRRTFYAPDTSDLKPEVIEILKGVDNLVMDSTFWENHGTARSHHDVRQTVHEGIDILDAGHIYLTHLAPHMCDPGVNEIDEIYAYAAQFDGRVVVAEDGMQFTL